MSKKARPRKRSDARAAAPRQKPPLTLIAAAVAAPVILAVLLLSPVTDVAGIFSSEDADKRAVIVDQLSTTQPNPAFSDNATRVLEADGYSVDYYSGDQVTVDLYRNLPKADYDLVILRTHSTAVVSRGEEDVEAVSLFTNEPYTKERYYQEQVEGKIGFAQYHEGGEQWFGITTSFIRESMKGDFADALVIGMGCQGLVNDLAAEAFAQKGASTFVGWDKNVSAAHTDKATERLIQLVVAEGLSPEEATAKTMQELGPDPFYGGSLVSRS